MRSALAIIFFLALAFPSAAGAQLHGGYCDTAKSTAETGDCVNRHKSAAQAKLQETYNNLSKQQDENLRQVLAKAQAGWLAYRDAECAWEAQWAEAPSLERIYELSCIARLTEERTATLAAILQRQESKKPPEFSETPRWMNVLAHDYPDIFWRHGDWLGTDLDCDGEREQVIPGIRVTARNGKPPLTAVIAIARNPVTGRPRIKLLELPLAGEAAARETPYLCSTDIKLMPTAQPRQKPPAEGNPQEEEARQCRTMLQVTDQKCPPVVIHWNGADFVAQQAQPPQE